MEVVNWLNQHLCQPPKESNPIASRWPADNHLDGMNKDTGIRNRKGAPRADYGVQTRSEINEQQRR